MFKRVNKTLLTVLLSILSLAIVCTFVTLSPLTGKATGAGIMADNYAVIVNESDISINDEEFATTLNVNGTPKTLRFGMASGAELRLDEQTGLRVSTFIAYEDYSYLMNTYGAQNVEFGVLFLPTDLLSGDLTVDTAKVGGGKITAKRFYKDAQLNNYVVRFNGVMQKVAGGVEMDVERALSYVSYVKVTAGGTAYYAYTNYNADNNSKSAQEVALDLVSTNLSEAELAILDSYFENVDKTSEVVALEASTEDVALTLKTELELTEDVLKVFDITGQTAQVVESSYFADKDAGDEAARTKTLKVYTNSKVYKVKVLIASQLIDTIEEYNAIFTPDNAEWEHDESASNTYGTGKYYVLTKDLDATGTSYQVLGRYTEISGTESVGFQGTLDGRGYTISNLTTQGFVGYESPNGEHDHGGLFGAIGKDGVIKNIAFENVQKLADNGKYTRAFANTLQGTIDNVYFSSSAQFYAMFQRAYADAKINNFVYVSTFDGQYYGNSQTICLTHEGGPSITNFNIYMKDNGKTGNYAAYDIDVKESYADGVVDTSAFSSDIWEISPDNIPMFKTSGELVKYPNKTAAMTRNAELDLVELIGDYVYEMEAVAGVELVDGVLTTGVDVAVEQVVVNAKDKIYGIPFTVTVSINPILPAPVEEYILPTDETKEIDLSTYSASGNVYIGGNQAINSTVLDGIVTIAKADVEDLVGEQNVVIGSSSTNGVVFKLIVATNAISTIEDFNAMFTPDNAEWEHDDSASNTYGTGKYYVLTKDLDATGTSYQVLGRYTEITGTESVGFQGTLDGRGYTISNLTTQGFVGYNSPNGEHDHGGLFGAIGKDGVIKNIAFENVQPGYNAKYTRAFANTLQGTIDNVYFSSYAQFNAMFQRAYAGAKINNFVYVSTFDGQYYGDSQTICKTYEGGPSITNFNIYMKDNGKTGNYAAYDIDVKESYADGVVDTSAFSSDIWEISPDNIPMFKTSKESAKYTNKTATMNKYDSIDLSTVIGDYVYEMEAVAGVELSDGILTTTVDVAVESIVINAKDKVYGFPFTVTVSINPILPAPVEEYILPTDETKEIDLSTYSAAGSVYIGETQLVNSTVLDGIVTIAKADVVGLVGEQQVVVGSSATNGVAFKLIVATHVISEASQLTSIYDGQSDEKPYSYGAGKYIVLANNINATDITLEPKGHNWDYNNDADTTNLGFQGTFDGRGFTISNVKAGSFENTFTYTNGIFGAIATSGVVKNVAFKNVNGPEQTKHMYLFAGLIAGTIENVYIETSLEWKGVSYSIYPSATIKNLVYVNNLSSTSTRFNEAFRTNAGSGSAGVTVDNMYMFATDVVPTYSLGSTADLSTSGFYNISDTESYASVVYGLDSAYWTVDANNIPRFIEKA